MPDYKFSAEHAQGIGFGKKLTRTVIKINGVNISFYNSHLGLDSKQREKQFKKIAEIVKNDPNPVIITADWNVKTWKVKDKKKKTYEELSEEVKTELFTKYFVNDDMNFKIVAYDTTKKNMWSASSYVDTILVDGKGHTDISIVKDKNGKNKNPVVIKAYGKYSDHNMVAVTLDIY